MDPDTRPKTFANTEDLASQECAPCEGDFPPLKGNELQRFLDVLGNNWRVIEEHHLEKEFAFPDFRTALDFTHRVGELAEQIGHHPDILLSWGKVKIMIWTHAINGLSENDFILAAKIEKLKSQKLSHQ